MMIFKIGKNIKVYKVIFLLIWNMVMKEEMIVKILVNIIKKIY